MQLRRRVFATAAAGAAIVAALASPFVAPLRTASAVPQSPPGWSRKAVIENARRWVDQGVPYSQTSWYRGYRQDCSGFVSMAWNIHASYPTGMMDIIAKPIPKEALLPGDVLLNNSGEYAHVVLFERWAYTDRSWYWGYEQLSSTNRPVRRLLPYPYARHPERYRPYRFTGLPPKPPTPRPVVATTAVPPPPAAPATRSATTSAQYERPSPPAGVPPLARLALALALAGAGGAGWRLAGAWRFPTRSP